MIRPALPADLDAIEALLPPLVAALNAAGNDQWHTGYPLRRHFEADRAAGALFVDDQEGRLRGFVALDRAEPAEYAAQPWVSPGPALAVHRLGVAPAFQGRGVARGLLAFADAEARRQGLPSLRSDTSALNPAMAALFASAGWTRVGALNFDDAACLFHSWEKVLTRVYEWTDRIAGGDGDGSGAFLRFPWDLRTEFGRANLVPVRVDFEGEPYQGSLANMGDGPLLVMVKAIRQKLGKRPGDAVRVRLWKDESPRTVEVPADLAAGLAADPGAQAFFDRLSPSHRKAYVQWLTEAKKPETRARRAAEAVAMLREGKKRQ